MISKQLCRQFKIVTSNCLDDGIVLLVNSFQSGCIISRPTDGEDANEKTRLIDHLQNATVGGFFSVFPLLQKQMGLTTVHLGLLGSSFAVVYGLGAPFAGYVVDRIRRKTAILGELQLWSVICVLSALSRNFFQLLIFRTMKGVGETVYYPAALSMISDYHGKRTRSRAMGILQTSVYAGTVGGGYWAGVVAQRHGWRAAIFIFGALGFLVGLGLIRLLREPVRGSADLEYNAGQMSDGASLAPALLSFRAMASLFRIKSLLALMAAFASANFVAMALLAWMPMYLYSRFHLSLSMAAFDAAVYPQVASMGGSVCGGYLADRLAERSRRGRVWVQCAGALAGVPFVVLCGLSGSLMLVIVALICWGFFKGSERYANHRFYKVGVVWFCRLASLGC